MEVFLSPVIIIQRRPISLPEIRLRNTQFCSPQFVEGDQEIVRGTCGAPIGNEWREEVNIHNILAALEHQNHLPDVCGVRK
jgi:hypothetical protein